MNQLRLWTLVVPTVLAVLVEVFNAVTGGPTWTSLAVQYVPQTVAQWAVGVLIGWLPKHIADAYKKRQQKKALDGTEG